MQMMKHKRSLSNYVTSCGPWHNEGKGPRISFWNWFFFFFHSGQDGLHALVRGTRQRNREGSPFKNQFTDNKNQEVVVCVARGSTSLLLAAPEVQTHHWVIQQQPLSCLWQSPIFPASPIRIQTTLETQYREQRRIFCAFFSLLHFSRQIITLSDTTMRVKKATASPVHAGEVLECDEGTALAGLRRGAFTAWRSKSLHP